jgi:Xaa-Pro dipeptidase
MSIKEAPEPLGSAALFSCPLLRTVLLYWATEPIALKEQTMIAQRRYLLGQILESMQLDGLVLNAGPSLTYFSGLHFHLMERPVLFFILPGRTPVMILPELERVKLDQLDFEVDTFLYPDNPARWPAIFSQACGHIGPGLARLGIEPGQLRMLEHGYLARAAAGLDLVDAEQAIAQIRSTKDEGEIKLMGKAVDIAQQALSATLPLIRIGMSERELAAELVIQLFRHGSQASLPFAPIVSSGPNSANPHAAPSDKKLSPGELLIIDWGAAWQGYISDLTRTFAIGQVEEEFVRIHELVRLANRAGLRTAGPTIACRAVDQAARRVIENGGYGACFTHRTGHGIGMQCHEAPYIHDGNDQLLQPGMTFTVEPGIYLKGKGGVRIEDDVIITNDGAESLSDFPRNLSVVG